MNLHIVPKNYQNFPKTQTVQKPFSQIYSQLTKTHLNALSWLEYGRINNYVSLTKDGYLLSREIGERFFSTIDTKGKWLFASYGTKTLYWFFSLPWEEKCCLNGIYLTLYAPQITLSGFNNDEVGIISGFSLTMHLHYLIAKEVNKEKEIGVGVAFHDKESDNYLFQTTQYLKINNRQ